MKSVLLPLTAALVFSPLTAAAATPPATDNTLPEVVVTATRLPDIPVPLPNTTVISREEIAACQSNSLADLLRQEAGLGIAMNGGPLTSTGLFFRGAAGKQVLVLVDGVRVNDANQGAFDLSQIRADDIDHIEITRGPYSAQYGSDAIGGVVQVFTRKSAGAEASLRAGSFHTQEFSAGARLGDSRNGIGLRLGYLDTDGFSASNRRSFAFDPDRDGGSMRTAQLSGQKAISDTLDASLQGSWKESQSEFDPGLSNQELGTASLKLAQRLGEKWRQTLQLGWLRDNLDTDGRSDPFAPYFSRFFTARASASWLQELQWAEGWRFVAGLDYADEQAESRDLLAGSSSFDKRLQNTGVFITQYADVDIYSASLSLREDDYDSFGRHGTGNLTLAAQVLPTTQLYAAYGTAFRAPSANDLYYPGYICVDPFTFLPIPGSSCYAGNLALQPETAKEGEFGVEFRQSGQRMRLSVYRNKVTDLITYGISSPYSLVNVNSALLQGVELEAGGSVASWRYKVNASRQSAEDGQGNDLPRRPQASLNALLEYAISDRLNAGTEIRARSHSEDGGQRLGGYTVFDIYAGWQPVPSLQLGIRLENVGDKQYQDVMGYNTAPRSGYVTAAWHWH